MTTDERTLRELMTPRPKTIGREQTLAKAKATMTELGVRHLPVLHGGRIEGILSSRDIALLERLPRVDSEVMTVEEAMSGVRVSFRIQAPHEVVEHNATKVDGDTLLWDYDMKALQKMGEEGADEGTLVRFKK